MSNNHDAKFDNSIKTVRLDELCEVATNYRGGIPCALSRHTIGGFNVVYELVLDNVVWMARIPLPYNCFQAEDVSASYAATLKYLKSHSTIPIPTVFAYCLHSSAENKVNATYTLMEQLPGHQLPLLEQKDFHPDPEDLAFARKVGQQLTDSVFSSWSFEPGLMGPYTSLVLPRLSKQVHNRPFDPDVECQRIADMRKWFKESLGAV